MEEFRKLTPRDLAFGIGRKATQDELREWLSRPDTGEGIDAMQVLKEIQDRLANKKVNKPQ